MTIMKSHLIRTMTVLVAFMFSTTSVLAQLDVATVAYLESEIEKGNFIGVMVAVADGDDITYQGFGQVSRESGAQPDKNTVFEIGSVTKTFTATLLAQMIQAGSVSLDDAVQDLLPDGITLAQVGDRPITLGDLATHRSGLPRMPADFIPEDSLDPYAGITVEDLWRTVNTIMPTAMPGERYAYSNIGYALLGQVLARQTDMSYEALLRRNILEPLAMHNSDLRLTERLRPAAATGYGQDGEPTPYWQIDGGYAPAGAINSTAADVLKYLLANLGAAGPLELRNAMRMTHESRQPMEGTNMRIGLGWISMPIGSGHWHNGGTNGFHSFVGFRPDTGRAVVLWTNSFTPEDGIDTIGMHILNDDVPLPTARPAREMRQEISLSEALLAEYTGQYLMDFGATLTFTVEDSQLLAQLTGQQPYPVFPEAVDQFFYRIVDAQLEFQRDDSGDVTGVILKQGGQTMRGKRQ